MKVFTIRVKRARREQQAFLFFILIIFSIVLITNQITATESINNIMVILGKSPITKIDYELGQAKYDKVRPFIPEIQKNASYKTRVLNFLIDRLIINRAAEEESIQVDEKRVDSEIEKRMKMMEIADEKIFATTIAKQTGIPYDVWVSEIPYQIKKAQLLQVRISSPLPSESEIKKWYNANRHKVGFEVKYREIVMIPNDRSISEEARIFNEIKLLRKEITNAQTFRLVASSPRNNSILRAYGGLANYIPAFDLYKKSKILASITSQLSSGEISEVFKDEQNRYCILLLEDKRATPLDQVRRGIQNVLYRDKEEDSFINWLIESRDKIPMKFYDQDYIKENKITKQFEDYEYK